MEPPTWELDEELDKKSKQILCMLEEEEEEQDQKKKAFKSLDVIVIDDSTDNDIELSYLAGGQNSPKLFETRGFSSTGLSTTVYYKATCRLFRVPLRPTRVSPKLMLWLVRENEE